MYRIVDLLSSQEVAQCREIAAAATFVDGKVSNPHNKAKQNEQLHEQTAYQRSAKIIIDAMGRSAEFLEFAFPAQIAPPLLTRYRPGMRYGAHADAAYLPLPGGTLRSDISCTVFLNEPETYEGGSLHIRLGDADLRFKLNPGQAILYPSNTLHEVEPVTKGERLVAITFIQSRVSDPFHRSMIFELNELAALEGNNISPENFSRLQLIQANLLRYWGEQP
ncbi:MAG TPA: Fe2+-dependent dioxygenase [Sphingomicrobium sp.]|jgi:PKHD-type hydroxylase|nr:Fe2+-dependent dioxygenase [Sphingomicrobium sp.]